MGVCKVSGESIRPFTHEEAQAYFEAELAKYSPDDIYGHTLRAHQDEVWWMVAHGRTEGLSRGEVRWAIEEGAQG
jgi:hypothetical protein